MYGPECGGVQVLLLVAVDVAGGGASCASRGRADRRLPCYAAESALDLLLDAMLDVGWPENEMMI